MEIFLKVKCVARESVDAEGGLFGIGMIVEAERPHYVQGIGRMQVFCYLFAPHALFELTV
jgi:hypothetical protein